MSRAAAFFNRHPAVRDALLWGLPAVAFGLVLRAMLLACQPLAFWGADSESYYSFAHRLLHDGVASIPAKRRFLYPILLLPVAALPGAPLRSLAWIQHAMGLLTIFPLAYAVRKIFDGWRWWVVPITAIYAGLPILLWYEQELLAEAFFFATLTWAFAAWVAWESRAHRGDRAPDLWWIFFACLALCALTKPASRFFWPGLLVGLCYVRAWRLLRWPQWTAFAALIAATFAMGEGSQASRLLYTSAFPLTVLDSPRHADLKAEIAPFVRTARGHIDYYYEEDEGPKAFLRGGFRSGPFPAWQAIERKSDAALSAAMRDLAIEAALSKPHLLLYIALQRAVAALNWTVFKLDRFDAGYFAEKYRPDFVNLVREGRVKKLAMARTAFGLPPSAGSPQFADILERTRAPGRDGFEQVMRGYVEWVSALGVFVAEPVVGDFRRTLWQMTPTPLGWVLLAGCLLSIALPALRPTLGVWLVIVIGYAIGVHLLGGSNPRFLAPAWPPLLLALFAPLEILFRLARRRPVFR
ncbi:MAG: hypothetical protein PHC88_08165 [Terrimicrobiaceae bacterium]|nr:hypothetical protein [Terrimicrobiaceae bacterium]